MKLKQLVTVAASSAVVVGITAVPATLSAAPGDTALAEAQFLDGTLLTADPNNIVTLGGESASSDGTASETNFDTLTVGALGLNLLDIPGGIQIPLDATDVGVVGQYAHADIDGSSIASTGTISETGGIGTGTTPAPGVAPGPLSLSLGGVLDNLGLAALTDVADLALVVDGVSATASQAAPNAASGDYSIGDLHLVLDSDAVAQVGQLLNDTVVQLGTEINDLDGVLTTVLNGLVGPIIGNDAITITPPDLTALSALTGGPIGSSDPACQAVSIDLSSGQVVVDLDEILALNGRPANTEVLDAAVINDIVNRLGCVLNEIVTDATAAVTAALDAVAINIDVLVDPAGIELLNINGSIDIDEVGGVLGVYTSFPTFSIVGLPLDEAGLLDALTMPLNDLLATVLDPVSGLLPTVTASLTELVTGLDGVFAALVDNDVLSIVVNGQETVNGQFTETAMIVSVLAGAELVDLKLANASVGANTLGAPVALSLDPDRGPETGGTDVTITGYNFLEADEVLVDGDPVSFTINSDTEIVFTTNAHVPATVPVVVGSPYGASDPLDFTFYPVGVSATIADLDPDQGPVEGGTTVVISGSGFENSTAVLLDGDTVTDVNFVDDNTIVIVTPPHARGPVDVQVLDPDGDSNTMTYTYLDRITIDEVDPDEGPIDGGNLVVITGRCFTGATDVQFDGISVDQFSVIDDNTIEAIVPAHPEGTVDVAVFGGPYCADGELPEGYTYVDPDDTIEEATTTTTTAPPAPEPTVPDRLPETGSNTVQMMLAALLMLLGGGSLLVLRRRTV